MANNSTTNCLFKGEEYYCTAVEITVRSIASFSIVSSVFVLLLIFLLKRYKFTSQRLVLYLVLASFLDSIEIALSGIELSDSPLCSVDGFFRMLLRWELVVWVCNITTNLFWNVVIGRKSNVYLEIFYICVGIAVPIFFSVFPFIDSSYGPAGTWCWINNKRPAGKILRFAIWYVPLWVTIFLIFCIYLIIIIKMVCEIRKWYDRKDEKRQKLIKKEIKPLIRYPLYFLVINIFPIINRIQNAVRPDHPVFILYFFHAISTALLGLGFTLLFVFSRDTLRELKWSNFKLTVMNRFKKTTSITSFAISKTETPLSEHTLPRNEKKLY